MPLHYVDPNTQRGPLHWAGERFGRSPVGQFVARHISPRIDPWLYRITRGHLRVGIATAPLVTTGAKSGERREVQLTYFHDGADPVVVASNYGRRTHPQWYHNLVANPQCRFGDEAFTAAEVSDPQEYARLFRLAERVYSGYRDYRTDTAQIRRIPIFRLAPAARAAAR